MTQVCVIIPSLKAPDGARLTAEALAGGPVAAVIIAPAGGGPIAPDAALPMIAAAQKGGAAALIYGDAQLARALKADGVHLPTREDIVAAAEEAREILGRGGIVGADAGASRHDAMELGELGVDYVAFGLSSDAEDADGREARFDLVAWWSEIFEVPVVAFDVADVQEAAALAAVNADFICVALDAGKDADFVKDLTAAVASVIEEPAA